MKKQKKKVKPKTNRETFIREWILLCMEQLGYTNKLYKKEKTISALELMQNNTFLPKEKDKNAGK
ncbi:hypothetical protein KC622_03650 [Candidatus Dojkabacteria bacterium]|uniref:Uncharacterized protein n=1 Tax=Candidatus Dojkabacteria bacterium TaxID=2099670 RepID=A0A955HZF0_9BACT|nr:hypothetical protein [Candidatus Dojkabacteria bacterium]